MELSEKQEEAYEAIRDWYNGGEKYFTLAGYAGTGKSTIATHVAERLVGEGRAVFCAYTGKAANVLKQKGCGKAGTIHSFFYRLEGKEKGKLIFVLNEQRKHLEHEWHISDAPLVIIDEYSMIPDKMLADILKLSKRVLFLGDPAQLPPVNGTQSLEPDFFLDEVHRQAMGNPILKAATIVRQGGKLDYCDWGEFYYAKEENVKDAAFYKADQIVCGKNKTRHGINKHFLEYHKFDVGEKMLPTGTGEKIICVQNNGKLGLFNGMIGTCTKARVSMGGSVTIDFLCNGKTYKEIEVDPKVFTGEKTNFSHEISKFEYAYAITCHKAQGSEFGSVVIINEPVGRSKKDKISWLYTALTRASERAVLVG